MATAPPLPDLDFEAMTAEDVLRWASDEFGDGLCLTCSWQRQSSVLVHMVSELGLDVDVIELDTLVLFPETYATRDALVERYGLRLRSVRPVDPPDRLWETDPDACCGIRKVRPLERALAGYDAWITGIRREQSPTRAGARKLEWSERYGVWKVQPLVDWDAKRVDAYAVVNEIPVNALHAQGYPSIGCVPCTRAVAPGDDERSGRWAGSSKLECGIHGDGRPGREIGG
ncbi:MAG TPA: phosphoadenylyl-sulfate reductase [Gaiellaceae bacterium]|nr:phosphoadenylyl-sulfate reductase [Gaiellaceae bacterium]